MNRTPRAILFDMDGTLTVPVLDFPRLKAEMGIGERAILEALAEMDEPARRTALAVLHRHEAAAAEQCALNPGCQSLLQWLQAHQIAVALITRNSRQSVETVLNRHRLVIDIRIAREDAPHKPDPTPLHLAIEKLQRNDPRIDASCVWMVGDGQYDIEAAVAAGVQGVWISHGRERYFDAEPWRTVRDLIELRQMLEELNREHG